MKYGTKENPVIKGELLPYEWLAKEEANRAPQTTKAVAVTVAWMPELDIKFIFLQMPLILTTGFWGNKLGLNWKLLP